MLFGNPNMPLRGILYSARLFSKYIKANKLNIYSEKLIKIPTPQYYMLYNGKRKIKDKVILRLSDAFSALQNEGQFEWTATVLNINKGHNEELLSKCQILKEYVILIDRINENQKKYDSVEEAVENAVSYCIKNNILQDFLTEHKAEVIMSLLTEYDEEEAMEYFKQRAYEDGIVKGELQLLVSNICKKMIKNKSIEQIADELEEDVSKIRKIYDIAKEFAPDYNVEKIMAKLG